MLERRDRPVVAAIFSLAAVLLLCWALPPASLAAAPAHTVADVKPASDQDECAKPVADNASAFFKIGHWANCYHNTIEALTALGALIAAGVLALVTGLLWWATRSLAISTEHLARGATDQVSEMKEATLVAKKQLDIACESHDLAIKEHKVNWIKFHTEHRPRIAIRSIGINRPDADKEDLFIGGHTIEGSLVVRNTGGSEATIKSAEYLIYMDHRGLPMNPPYNQGRSSQLIADLPQTIAPSAPCASGLRVTNLLWMSFRSGTEASGFG